VTGRLSEAIAHFQEAARLSPSRARSHIDLGAALVIAGKAPEGVARFREAARLDPQSAAPWNALAWLRATHPDPAVFDGEEAIALAMRARRLAGDRPVILDTLAAAYASAGRFDEAAAAAERGRTAALAAGNERLAESIRQRLVLYRSRTPFRESGAAVMFARLIAEV
jgi:Flp pilus assembly protein TadD